MKIIKGDITKINHIDGIEKSIVVIGTFDGLHTYHQKILREAEKISVRDNLQLILVTFDKPVKALFTGKDEKMITNQEKIDYCENYFAIDYYIELESNKNLISVNKTQFLVWMKDVLKTIKVIEGSDFTFGANKEGTIEDLKNFFGEDNVIVFKRRVSVSSTKIHKLIAEGKIDKANKLLFKSLTIYLNHENDIVKTITFPNIEIKDGYYDVLIDDDIPATIVIADSKSVSIVDIKTELTKSPKTMTLIKYIGKTLN